MTRKRTFRLAALATVAILAVGSITVAYAWWGKTDKVEDVATDAIEIQWQDLVPEGFEPAANPMADMTAEQIDKLFDGSEESKKVLEKIETDMAYAPTVDSLDGQKVKIPGYVVPLDFDGQTQLSEFLLVPYYGACIHTPPPPANQVVHALPETSIEVDNTYDPVYAIGVIRTETRTSDLAEAGYILEIEKVVPYQP